MTTQPIRARPIRPRGIVQSIRAGLRLTRLVETVPSLLFEIFKSLRLVKMPLDLTARTAGPLRYEAAAGLQAPASYHLESVAPLLRGHPIIDILRQRAAIELLAWLGIYWIPGRSLKELDT